MSAADLKPWELLQKAADLFDSIQVPYRIVGSMAAMAYGEPRFTNDIDILVDLKLHHVDSLVEAFPEPDFYLSPEAARTAIRDRRQFNIIHFPSGLKLDIIQCKETAFGREDIQRGRRIAGDGAFDAWFATPENVIIVKLRYFKEGGSDKHLRDIRSILSIQGDLIDRAYVEHWGRQLDLLTEWQMVSA